MSDPIQLLRHRWNKYLQSQPYITIQQLQQLSVRHAEPEPITGSNKSITNTVGEVNHDNHISHQQLVELDELAEQPVDDEFMETLRRKSMRWQPHSTGKAMNRRIIESSSSDSDDQEKDNGNGNDNYDNQQYNAIDQELQHVTDSQIDAAIHLDSLRRGIPNTAIVAYTDTNYEDAEIIDLCGSDDSDSEIENAQIFKRLSRKFELPALISDDDQPNSIDTHSTNTHSNGNNTLYNDHNQNVDDNEREISIDSDQLYPVSPLMLTVKKKKIRRIIESDNDTDDADNKGNTPVKHNNIYSNISKPSNDFVGPGKQIKTSDRVGYSDFKSRIAAANSARKQQVFVSSDDDDSNNSQSDNEQYNYDDDDDAHSSDNDFVVDDNDDTGYGSHHRHPSDTDNNNEIILTKSNRDELTRQLYNDYNKTVLQNALPHDMRIEWNNKLNKTAGYCYMTQYGNKSYAARIELSTKVVDRYSRLERTLAHEMCHAAAWIIDQCNKPPHGKLFKQWANKFMCVYNNIDISTCHNYDIFYKYRWQCTECMHIYGRHSNSVDITSKCCGKCSGHLVYLGQFDQKTNAVKQSTSRPATGFALYMKNNYSAVKSKNYGASQKELFQLLSAQYKSSKSDSIDTLTNSIARKLQL